MQSYISIYRHHDFCDDNVKPVKMASFVQYLQAYYKGMWYQLCLHRANFIQELMHKMI